MHALRRQPLDASPGNAPGRLLAPMPQAVSRPHVAVPAIDPRAAAVRRRRVPPMLVGLLVLAAALGFGYLLPSSAYLTPQSGLGYALGIAGGSLMLLLLLYPLRKRLPRAQYLGPTRLWFQAHMVLGLVGPALVIVHANYSLGATNSNVAFICMLVVSGSGLFGRYFYRRIHVELHGREATLEELKEYASRMRQVTSAVSYLPELTQQVDAEEEHISRRIERWPLLLQPVGGWYWALSARRRLRATVRSAVAAGADRRRDPARERLEQAAGRYIRDRLAATRRVIEFRAFERLFSVWHALHMPLFVLLVIAGIVHVFAVHLY